ncbi:MAG: hypothetical protein ACU88J_03370 [Gammaproteobacteria bacterium]
MNWRSAMKTRKHNLSAVAVGVALATASLSALAVNPTVGNPAAQGGRQIILNELFNATPPTFNQGEQAGLCLLESVVGLIATTTNDFGCSGTYDLSINTFDVEGRGLAEIDLGVDNGGTTLIGILDPTRDIGTRCNVNTVYGDNKLKRVGIRYDGDHGWSKTNEIFNSDAYITLKDPQTGGYNKYREVDIKDYFKQVVFGRSWEYNWGLEDVKKFRYGPKDLSSDNRVADNQNLSRDKWTWHGFYYPVQKWQEASWYQHENGQEGGLWLRKYQVIPRSAAGCQIHVEADDIFNGSGEFQMHGTVRVGKFPRAPFLGL